ncbi:hypothetical protein [Natrarchaeobaculum aegyptiacum]|uniref:Uncharacterized protein n=1 Tax=Natrarchaeobaculum aegyptiacum TaxID=745377 RepID=A0A2Z2HVC5_9EURY|nr:hypothetical protein [Natrarchaeobaculum aegyptiacum]ARS90125.1 hypothetical protein B1756_10555 [Natrarchaeobaculum aegyptiacum]
MEFTAFVLATAVAHVGFAIFVTAHAKLTAQDAGNWPYLTLLLGLAGVAGYFFYDEIAESGRI